MIYQILNSAGQVVNTIIASEEFVQETYPGLYRLVGPDPAPPPTWIITKVSMISRFTPQEYVAVVAATKTDVEVQAWYDLFQAATKVDLQDPRTIAGINSLASKNILTQDRVNLILTTPARLDEIPS